MKYLYIYLLIGFVLATIMINLAKKNNARLENSLAKTLTFLIIMIGWGIIFPLAIFLIRKEMNKK